MFEEEIIRKIDSNQIKKLIYVTYGESETLI